MIWLKNGDTVIFQSTVKNGILSSFDLSTLFAYNFLSLKVSKTWLVSSERSFKKLSEAHEFLLIWLKNGNTVISQSTVNKADTRPIPVTDGWAGAEIRDGPTDRLTNQRTDGQSLL